MLDLRALEEAFAPITSLGQQELTFDAGPTKVTLRALVPEEELAVQRYAAEVVDPENPDMMSAQQYLDRFRIAILSTSLVQIGNLDLRCQDMVATGETLPNGKPVMVQKAKAIRQLLADWSQPIVDAMFRKYGEVVDLLEAKTTKAIHFDPTNLDTEIERLESRVAVLKEERERRKNNSKSMFNDMVREASKESQEAKHVREEGLDKLKTLPAIPEKAPVEQPVSVEQPVPQPAPRVPAIPPSGSAPRIDAPVPSNRQAPAPRPPEGPRSSFVDTSDQEGMAAEAEAETMRIMRRRAGIIDPPPALRTQQRPPHLDARDTEQEVSTLLAAKRAGTMDGVDVYQLPVQELGPREPAQVKPAAPPPPAPDGGSINPRFRRERQ